MLNAPAARNGRHDEGKAFGEIVAVAGTEPHALGVASRHDAEAVVLDLVQPSGTAGLALVTVGKGQRGRLREVYAAT
jgi:hypothetical protein